MAVEYRENSKATETISYILVEEMPIEMVAIDKSRAVFFFWQVQINHHTLQKYWR